MSYATVHILIYIIVIDLSSTMKCFNNVLNNKWVSK